MSTLGTIGKYLYAIPFVVFGSFHFARGSAMAGMVPIPGGTLWVYVSGVALVSAGVAIAIDRWVVLATALLGVMLLGFALTIHLPGMLGAADAAAQQASMSNLLKDTALAGAAWFIGGTYPARELGAGRAASEQPAGTAS